MLVACHEGGPSVWWAIGILVPLLILALTPIWIVLWAEARA